MRFVSLDDYKNLREIHDKEMSDSEREIAELRKSNPYPTDIFPELSKREIKKYVKLLLDNGFSSNKIHAHWMGVSWNNCCDELEKIKERASPQTGLIQKDDLRVEPRKVKG
jgi:hypothetical protein